VSEALLAAALRRHAHARSSRFSTIVNTIDATMLNRQPDVLN
jgi:hypothetical protein